MLESKKMKTIDKKLKNMIKSEDNSFSNKELYRNNLFKLDYSGEIRYNCIRNSEVARMYFDDEAILI